MESQQALSRSLSYSVVSVFFLALFLVGASGSLHAQGPSSLRGYDLLGGGWFVFPDAPGPSVSTGIIHLDGGEVPDAVAVFAGTPPTLRSYIATSPLCFEERAIVEIEFVGRLTLADVTGDGQLDAIVANSGNTRQIAVLVRNAESFVPTATFDHFGSSGLREIDVVTADFDSDGNVDIAFGGDGFLGIAYGPTFTPSQRILPRSSPRSSGLVVLDANGDQKADILFGSERFGNMGTLLLGDGNRQFESRSVSDLASGPIRVLDLDRDGENEIVARRFGDIVIQELQEIDGSWSATETPLFQSELRDVRDYALVDLDLDGAEDLVVTDGDNQLVEVLFGRRRDEALVVDPPALVTTRPGRVVQAISSAEITAVADIDGDSFRDLVFNQGYIRTTGPKTLRSSRKLADDDNHFRSTVGDLNGDGYADLVLRSSELGVYLGSETGLRPVIPGPDTPISGQLAVGQPAGRPQLFAITTPLAVVLELNDSAELAVVREIPWDLERLGFASFTSWNDTERDVLLTTQEQDSRQLITLVDVPDSGDPVQLWSLHSSFRTGTVQPVDLDGDPWTDLVYGEPDGAIVVRGSPGVPLAYSAALTFDWDFVRRSGTIDLEGDGTSEVLVAGRPRSQSETTGTALLRRASGDTWERVFLNVEQNFVVADLNDDGRPDVISGTSRIAWNDGQGGLVEGPPVGVPQTSDAATAVLDVDRDGQLDFVSRTHSSYLSVLYFESDGTYPMPADLAPECGSSIGLSDLNNDGYDDVVLDCEFGSASVLLSQPDGRLGASMEMIVDGDPIAVRTDRWILGDFTADGHSDMVFWSNGRIGSFLLPGNGDGTFAAEIPIPETGFFYAAKGDLDRNGTTDLVLGGLGARIFVLDGGDTFPQPPSWIDTGADLRDLAVVDLDGDGTLDIVYRAEDPSGDVWGVFPGMGDGSFEDAVSLPPVAVGSLENLVADVNGDGFPDTVRQDETATTRQIVLLLGNGDFTFLESEQGTTIGDIRAVALVDLDGDDREDYVGLLRDDAVVVAPGLEGGAFAGPKFFACYRPLLVAVTDLNLDELPDLLVGSGNQLGALLGSRKVLLDSPRVYRTPRYRLLEPADLDGDTEGELVAAMDDLNQVQILRGGSDRELEVVAELRLSDLGLSDTQDVAVHDRDGDTLDDLFVLTDSTVFVLRSRGDLTFEDPTVVAEEVTGHDLAFDDLDLDGNIDILVSGFTIVWGLGNGQFELGKSYGPGESFVSTVGDFDGDGTPDVFHGPTRAGVVFFSLGTGNGDFEAARRLPSGGEGLGGLATGDFNGDGLTDIVVGPSGSGNPRPWYAQGNGELERSRDLESPLRFPPEGTGALIAFDADGDGFDDLFAAHPRGAIVVYRGSEQGLVATGPVVYGPFQPDFLFVANFTGDSTADLVFAEDGSGLFSTPGKRLPPPAVQFPGDTDQNGSVDALDGLALLGALFVGDPLLPCGDGSNRDRANVVLLDWQPDGEIDVSDAISVFRHLYLNGPPHALATGAGSGGCVSIPGCFENPVCGAP